MPTASPGFPESRFLTRCSRSLRRGILAKVAEGPETKADEFVVLPGFAEHGGGFFRRPRRSKTSGAIREPEGSERHDRGVLREDVGLHSFEGIGGGVVRVFVVGRILIKIDAGKAGENERRGIGFEFNFVGDLDVADIFEGVGKGLEGFDEIVTAAELEFLNGSLTEIKDDGGEMILHFGGVLLDIGERTAQALLFAGEEDETNSAAGTRAAFDDGVGGGEGGGDAGAVVRGAFTEIPRIEMPADHNDFFGMLATRNFADDIGAFDGAAGELILEVHADADGFAFEQITLDLALVFAGESANRHCEILGEAEDAGVGQVEAFGPEAVVAADDREGAFLVGGVQELADLGEDGTEASFRPALRPEENNFTAKRFGVLDGGVEIEDVDRREIGFDAARGGGTGPAHGCDFERAMQRREHFSLRDAACPSFPQGVFFEANILQADGAHFGEAPFGGLAIGGATGEARADVVAEFGEVLEGVGVHGGIAGDFGEGGFGAVVGGGLRRGRRGGGIGGEEKGCCQDELAKGHASSLLEFWFMGKHPI